MLCVLSPTKTKKYKRNTQSRVNPWKGTYKTITTIIYRDIHLYIKAVYMFKLIFVQHHNRGCEEGNRMVYSFNPFLPAPNRHFKSVLFVVSFFFFQIITAKRKFLLYLSTKIFKTLYFLHIYLFINQWV